MVICPNCKKDVEFGDGYCIECGSPIRSEQAYVSQQPAQQAAQQQPNYPHSGPQTSYSQQAAQQQPDYPQSGPQTSHSQQAAQQQPDYPQSGPQTSHSQQAAQQQPNYPHSGPQASYSQQAMQQQSDYSQSGPQPGSYPQQADYQQSSSQSLKDRFNKINPFSKNKNEQPFAQQTIPSQSPEFAAPYSNPQNIQPQEFINAGRLLLPDQSLISIDQNERQFGRADFVRNFPENIYKYISKEHFKILCENGIFYIVDTDSRNGTRLNGSDQMKTNCKYQLNEGDRILLADELELVFIIK